MTTRPRTSKLAAVLASAAVLAPLAPAGAAARPARLRVDSVTISVAAVSPTVLPTTATPEPLTVTLNVTNRSDQPIDGLTIEGERGEPLTKQSELENLIKHPGQPQGSVLAIKPTAPVRVDLAPGERQQVVFRSTTSTTTDGGGLCNCAQQSQPWMYPLYFSGHVKGAGGVDQRLGLATTFVSAFYEAPAPVRVSWVWPLIDQPHLLDDTPVGTGGPVFTDDFLAASVGTGGRLDRALAVAEQVAHTVPITLLVDPELLDELQLMASGPYQVRAEKGTVPGTGKALAAAWLQRLQALLGTAPQLRLQLTPYADPDVEALHSAGLSWSTDLPDPIREHVEQALGGRTAESTLAWPAGGTVSRSTLNVLAGAGVGTVLVRSSAVTTTPKPASDAVRPGLARLNAAARDVAAGLLDPTLQRYVAQAVTSGAAGTSVLPLLLSELNVRAVQEPTIEHTAVLTPPRWVDPAVDDAARVIEATSTSLVTRPTALAAAVGGELLPTHRSRLTAAPASARTLPGFIVDAANRATNDLPALRSLLTPSRPQTIDPRAKALLDELPLETQRITASAWGRPGNALSGNRFATALTDQLNGLTHGVTIASSGSYTLTSDNSPLPITVHNNLPYQVSVTVQVTPVNALPGFAAKPASKVVEAHQKATLYLQTTIDRTGRFGVEAALLTTDGRYRIGEPVQMTVRSTALGVIGLIITIVAGAVLALALVVRFGRRLRHRWSRNSADRPRWDPDAPDAPADPAGRAPVEAEGPMAQPEPVERAP